MGNESSSTSRAHKLQSNPKEPLTFHTTHSEHVKLFSEAKVARRVESFCKGICFSARPVAVGEVVLLKCSEISTNWSGFLRVGFTANNPATMIAANLPRYACPDMTNQPGNWAKALPERFGTVDNVIGYYVNRQGEVNISFNGEDLPGPFFNSVNVHSPLWALVDIYGNATGVEFLDPTSANIRAASPATDSALTRRHTTASVVSPSRIPLHAPSKHHSRTIFQPIHLHQTTGRCIALNADKTVATRHSAEYSNAYIFTERPLYLAEKLVIQVVGMDASFTGGLTVGMTACDPVTLTNTDFPDDSDQLLDRPEYWVVHKDVLSTAQVGDELSFMLTNDGEVQFARNANAPVVIMHVDKTIPLWLFWDLYGQFHQIKVFGVTQAGPRQKLPPPVPADSTRPMSALRSLSLSETPGMSRSALTVELPPPMDSISAAGAPPRPPRLPKNSGAASAGATASGAHSPSNQATGSAAAAALDSYESENNDNMANECTVCLEKACDSVVYTCGHMCMCYDCAMNVKASSDPLCPICRQDIKDVIRIYKS